MRRVALAFACAAAALAQEGPVSPGVPLLVRAMQQALDNLDRLPDYVCTQTVERFTRPRRGRDFKRQDRVVFEVAYIGGTELYAWPGSDSFSKETPHELLGYGVSNTGPFGLHLRAIFNDATTVRYTGTERIAGRLAARYDFQAPAFPIPIRLHARGKTGEAGSRGSFWVDWKTGDVVLIEVHADGIPKDIDVGSAVDRVAYARVKLGDREVLLPAAAEMELTDRAGNASRNESKFAACRQYTAASSISFSETAPADAPPPITTRALPSNLPLITALESGIDESTLVGSVIRARVTERSGPVPKDARVTGVMRGITRHPAGGTAVIIEFSEIEYGRFRAPFRAELAGLGPNSPESVFNPMPEGGRGIATVPLPAPQGLVIRWRTEK